MKSRILSRAGAYVVAIALIASIVAAIGTAVLAQSGSAHTVKGGATFFLQTGAPNGGNLILHYSINASVNADGTAQGTIASTINSIVLPAHGIPDPFGTGDPNRYKITGMTVVGNEAFIVAVLVFSPDFPQSVGTTSFFDVVDNGGPPNAGDTVTINGFGPLVAVAGNIAVR